MSGLSTADDAFEPAYSPEKFWSKVDRSGDCWIWRGEHHNLGYGVVRVKGQKRVLAHRMSVWLATGKKPSQQSEVCHTCDNPPCVRPSHLYVGTHADNMRDMAVRGRAHGGGLKGERNGRAKLNRAQVDEIRAKWNAGDGTLTSLGRDYGVSYVAIRYIVQGKLWK